MQADLTDHPIATVAPRALPVNSSFENYTAFTPAPSREAEVNRMIATS